MNCELPAETSYKGECSSWGVEGDFLSPMLTYSQSGRRARVRRGYLEAGLFSSLLCTYCLSCVLTGYLILALDGWIMWVRGVA